MPVSASPILRAARKALGQKQYRELITEAHKRGFKAESYVSGKSKGVPEGMLERTTTSLRNEATSAVGAAFKPAETQLSTALERETALNDKRDRDMQAFIQWSSGQQFRFQQAALAASQSIIGQNKDILDQQSAARQQTLGAIQAQLAPLGGGLAAAGANAVAIRPDSQAATAAAASSVATDASKATYAAERGVGSLNFMQGNQLGALSAQRQTMLTKGDTNRTAIIDRIAELAGKKAGAFTDAMAQLTGNEQKKVTSQYEAQVASDIAAGKQSFQAEQNAANRAAVAANVKANNTTRSAIADAANNTRLTIAQANRTAADARAAVKGKQSDADFKAKYGLTRDQVNKMNPTQLATHLKKYGLPGGKKAGAVTQVQAEVHTKDLTRAISKLHGLKPGTLTTQQMMDLLAGGSTPVLDPVTGHPKLDKAGHPVDPGFKQVHPAIARAATELAVHGKLSRGTKHRLQILGIDTSHYPGGK